MIPTAKLAQKRAKLRTKLNGTSVTLRWVTWPDGKPALDPTTGAAITDPDKLPEDHFASVRVFVHFINPITSGIRQHAETEIGDAIVDFPLDLIQITDAGDTEFEAGQVVDELSFSHANRTLTEEEDSAVGNVIAPETLERVTMEFGGRYWVQKEVGEDLVRSWDTLYSGLNINRAMLMTSTGPT